MSRWAICHEKGILCARNGNKLPMRMLHKIPPVRVHFNAFLSAWIYTPTPGVSKVRPVDQRWPLVKFHPVSSFRHRIHTASKKIEIKKQMPNIKWLVENCFNVLLHYVKNSARLAPANFTI